MATPFFGHAGLLECSSPLEQLDKLDCTANIFEARELKGAVFGGCPKRQGTLASCCSLLTSCSDIASLDSENESSFYRRRSSSTFKSDEGACCTASDSPMAMLQCEDALEEDDCDEDATREWAPGRPARANMGPLYHHTDAEETLRNELSKEAELGPFTPTPLPVEYREALVHWMRDVCALRALSPATFFTSVSVLDRFSRSTVETATPPTLLQLVALTSVSISAKCHQQQCAGELLSLARDENGNLYRGEDSRMMEIHMLDTLGWRLRMPTVYTFVTLFLHRVINRPQDGQVVPPGTEAEFRGLVLRLAELAVLDHELTAVSYSVLAVACLLVAETEIKGGHMHANLKTVSSLRTVPGLPDLANLSAPVQRLYCLYKSVTAASPKA
ncbi:hypothetical protein Agub_g6007 [Astrephomene gubernaculifera]|uniref:Cyclin C-terminal domain-containing protein n=1 Tax=Astrephomene gubernaculifera TaxID=47775 RepID=A0AAD3DN39_9CHLO|nr:hypothetical protein Agub_g6007 [Astrephomene gubernaculifera]